jgi:hypothetical protein
MSVKFIDSNFRNSFFIILAAVVSMSNIAYKFFYAFLLVCNIVAGLFNYLVPKILLPIRTIVLPHSICQLIIAGHSHGKYFHFVIIGLLRLGQSVKNRFQMLEFFFDLVIWLSVNVAIPINPLIFMFFNWLKASDCNNSLSSDSLSPEFCFFFQQYETCNRQSIIRLFFRACLLISSNNRKLSTP